MKKYMKFRVKNKQTDLTVRTIFFKKREQRKAREMTPMAYYVSSRCLASTRLDEGVTFSVFWLLWQ